MSDDVAATMKDKMPKRIKVGSFTYRLHLVPTGDDGLGGENYGMTDLENSQIFFDDSISLERLANTMLHELQHAINNSYGINNGAKEEAIATQTANGWMQVNLDNPKLELWLHRLWRELRKARD